MAFQHHLPHGVRSNQYDWVQAETLNTNRIETN